MSIPQLLRKYNRISVPVISMLVAALFFYLSSALSPYSSEFLTLVLLIPLAVFLVFHYLGLWGIKRRLLYGLVIFIVVAFIGSAVSAAYIPYENNTESTKFSNGIGVTAFESPFSTQANSYNITIKLSNVTNFSSANYWIVYSGYTTGYGKNISKSGIKAVPMGAGNVDLYYESPPLHPDIYFYSFYYQNKSNVLAGIGPDLSYSSSLLLMLEIHYISYVILFMLEFTTGVFIARSIENSRKIRQERRAQ